jgi:hypothetical protein
MWNNFKGMPLVLKFLSAHGILFLVGGILSILPFGDRAIEGRNVSYSEWWASGTGFQFLLVSVGIGIGATFLLRKAKHARVVYFSLLLGVYLFIFALNLKSLGNIEILISPVLLGAIYWYLFHKQSVSRYFGANNL